MSDPSATDHVDRLVGQWARERPELDTAPLAVYARIVRLSRFGERASVNAIASHGLNPGELNVLAALRRSGDPYRLTPTELYRSLLLSSGAMTNRIDRLEQAGYVERVRDRTDRRKVSVCLTAAGRAVIDQAMDAHVGAVGSVLGNLTHPEQEQLADLLRQVLAKLETSGLDPTPPGELG